MKIEGALRGVLQPKSRDVGVQVFPHETEGGRADGPFVLRPPHGLPLRLAGRAHPDNSRAACRLSFQTVEHSCIQDFMYHGVHLQRRSPVHPRVREVGDTQRSSCVLQSCLISLVFRTLFFLNLKIQLSFRGHQLEGCLGILLFATRVLIRRAKVCC